MGHGTVLPGRRLCRSVAAPPVPSQVWRAAPSESRALGRRQTRHRDRSARPPFLPEFRGEFRGRHTRFLEQAVAEAGSISQRLVATRRPARLAKREERAGAVVTAAQAGRSGAPKGRDRIAQGEALGTLSHPHPSPERATWVPLPVALCRPYRADPTLTPGSRGVAPGCPIPALRAGDSSRSQAGAWEPEGRCRRHKTQGGAASRERRAPSQGKLQAASCKPQATSRELRATSHERRARGSCKLQASGHKPQAPSCKLQASGCKPRAESPA